MGIQQNYSFITILQFFSFQLMMQMPTQELDHLTEQEVEKVKGIMLIFTFLAVQLIKKL